MPALLYAQNESERQPNNSDDSAKEENTENSTEVTKELIRVNKSVSEKIDQAADAIDKTISPNTVGRVEKNKTKVYFIFGSDFADNGDIKTNFRYGAQLHLPRFEKYWKLKFANQNEKKERGRSSVVRDRRTRKANDEVFVGVSFLRNWDNIDVRYEPQIAIDDGIGLDHSIEAETKYEFGKFNMEPSLEFFANHDEGTGSSSSVQFIYWLKKFLALVQDNDVRYVYLSNELSVNHTIGLRYTATDKLNVSTHYFRSFTNEQGYILSAYGEYLTLSYTVYKNILSAEVMPYIVYEREEDFEQANGIVVNFRVNF